MMSSVFLALLFFTGLGVGKAMVETEKKDIGVLAKNVTQEGGIYTEEEVDDSDEYEEKQLERIGNLLLKATSNWMDSDKDLLDEMYDQAMKPCPELYEPRRRKRQAGGCSITCKRGSCSCAGCSRCYCGGLSGGTAKCEGFALPPTPPNGCSVTCKKGSCSCDTCNKCDCSRGLFNNRPYCYDALENGCKVWCRLSTVRCPNSKRCYCDMLGRGKCG